LGGISVMKAWPTKWGGEGMGRGLDKTGRQGLVRICRPQGEGASGGRVLNSKPNGGEKGVVWGKGGRGTADAGI